MCKQTLNRHEPWFWVCMRSFFYVLICGTLSLCANAGKKESHLRVQTNVVIYIYIYFVFVMIVQIEHSADEWRVSEWEKEREKAIERFAKCIEILQRIYKNIVFWAMNEVTIIFYYCLSFVRHNANILYWKRNELYAWNISLDFDSISGYVPYFLFFPTNSLWSMTFEKYVKFWHIPTYTHSM